MDFTIAEVAALQRLIQAAPQNPMHRELTPARRETRPLAGPLESGAQGHPGQPSVPQNLMQREATPKAPATGRRR